MKKVLISFLIVASFSCSVQKSQIVTPSKDASGNLVGITNKEGFQQDPFSDWYKPNYEYYTLDNSVIDQLEPLLKKVSVKAFMGTWCGDSQEHIPVFYKIMDAANYDYKNLEMITVNRQKTTPDNLQEGLDIIRVPTFIFYKQGKEIGRIVEFPQETIETDMLKIISGQPYKHSYEE